MVELLIFIGLPALVTFLVTLLVPHRWNKFLCVLAALVAYTFSFDFNGPSHYGGPGGVMGKAVVLFLATGLAVSFVAALAMKELFRERDPEPSKSSLASVACVALPALIAPAVVFGHFAVLRGMMSGRMAGLFLCGLSCLFIVTGLAWFLSAHRGRLHLSWTAIAILVAFGAGCALVTIESYRWSTKTLDAAKRTAGGKEFCIQVVGGTGYLSANSKDNLSPLVMRSEGVLSRFHAILFVSDDGIIRRYNWSYRLGSFQELDRSDWRALKLVCQTAKDGGVSEAA